MVVQTSRVVGYSDRIAVKFAEKPLETGSFPQYAGVGIAYLGDGRWALGFMDNDDPRERIWHRNVSFAQVHELLDKHAKFCIRQDEKMVFG